VGRNTLYDTASLVYPISNHHSCVHHSMISTLQTHKVYAKNCGSEVLLQTNNNTTAIVKLLEGHAEGIKIASQAEAVVPRDEVKKDDEWIINDGVVGPEEESIDCGVLKNEVRLGTCCMILHRSCIQSLIIIHVTPFNSFQQGEHGWIISVLWILGFRKGSEAFTFFCWWYEEDCFFAHVGYSIRCV